MSDTTLTSWVTFIYFTAFACYLFRLILGRDFWGRLATVTAWTGLVIQTIALLVRWKTSYDLGIGHVPLSNLYESMVFFSWAIVFLYLVLEWRKVGKAVGVFVVPIAFLVLAYASIAPGMSDRIQPLIPALQSNWLTSHVVTCFLGYAGFTLAFSISLIFFTRPATEIAGRQRKGWKARIPSSENLEALIYQCTAIGFVFLSLGIITGSIWAHYAWGSYWSWDPKETWSLITWIVYAIMLHARLVRGWRGRRVAFLALIGFACVLFTYFGVNYLPGLHSYLSI